MEKHILGLAKNRKSPWFLLFLTLLMLSSCDDVRASYRVASGNYAYGRGTYQNSNLNYFIAQGMNVHREIVDYNLGTVFYALGESGSAESLWSEIDSDGDDELAFRLVFNLGILEYRKGDYPGAYEKFKSSLFIDPSSLEAKINLEHSLAKMNAREGGSTGISPGAAPTKAGNEDVQRVLEYIKRQEPVQNPRQDSTGDPLNVEDW